MYVCDENDPLFYLASWFAVCTAFAALGYVFEVYLMYRQDKKRNG